MLKAYKYRIYPNKEQQVLIAKTFGCCRFVYNQTLAYRKKMYETEKKSVSKFDCNNYCNRELKTQYEWLREVDKHALTNAIYNMDNAYQKFFKEHAGYPKFKSKHDNHRSYKTSFNNGNIEVDFKGNKIKLPKLRFVKAKICREFDGKIKSVTISQNSSGKYFASVLFEYENQVQKVEPQTFLGLDFSMRELYKDSNGNEPAYPRYYRQAEQKLAKEQRKLSLMRKGSNNRNKQRIKVAKLHEKVANQRKDFLHKQSRQIANAYDCVCIEDLNMKAMS